MNDSDEANKIHKFLVAGVLHPEDLKQNEIRLLKKHRPGDYHFVKWWLENRQEMIENNQWTEEHEPPNNDRRINRYERGESVIDPFDPENE